MNKNEKVNHPQHYQECSIECIDAMLIAFGVKKVIHFCKCNAFKYIWRYQSKNGKEDLAKAQWYINKALELKEQDLYNIEDDQLKQMQIIIDNAMDKLQ